MKNSQYFKQAELLLRILPIINRESIFALKGGTAINFFVRDMPRLSVDIDLAYVPVNGRAEALQDISKSLLRIQENILKLNKSHPQEFAAMASSAALETMKGMSGASFTKEEMDKAAA